jgi:signal transduction histidine kinase
MNLHDRSWPRVIELLETAIFVTDEAYRVLYANSAGVALTRRKASEVEGKLLIQLVKELTPFLNSNASPQGMDPAAQLVQLAQPNGTSALFHVSVRARSEQAGEASEGPANPGASATGHLVSLHPLPQDLVPQRNSVSALMPTFLHELKNPLAAIATSVELLLEELPQGRFHHELMAIFGEIRRMKLVIDGVGIVGRKLRTQTRSAVQESLREACLVLQPLAKRKGISFETHIAQYPALPFDASVLKAVLFNLVMNAIHACSEGQTIRVSSLVAGNALRMMVEDNGHGMSKETLEQCTRLFFTTKTFGSGIGLALCQEVAKEASGTLEIQSQEGVGTRVIFEVPLHLERAEEPSRISTAGSEE